MLELEAGHSAAITSCIIVRSMRSFSKISPGSCTELHKNFKGRVNGLYYMIEKDGLKDP
jgi:hypothetical protein